MTTLTERLREFETTDIKIRNMSGQNIFHIVRAVDMHPVEGVKDVLTIAESHHSLLDLAQELHALLVECGEAMKTCGADGYDQWCDITEIEHALTKLQQAGIV